MQFLRIDAVCALTGFKKSTLYANIKQGTFPAPVKIGRRASAWSSVDVENWQKAQIDAGWKPVPVRRRAAA
jgi:prophage regulatory protein